MIPVDGSAVALRWRRLRIFRVLRLVFIIPELRTLLNAFLSAIPRMGYVSLRMFIIFYIFAAMGSIFCARINKILWGNISPIPRKLSFGSPPSMTGPTSCARQ